MLDILFVHPNASAEIYQELSKEHSAIETPIWAGMLAQAVRRKGFSVQILDCEAEGLDYKTAARTIKEISPRIVCLVVYGQQPSASTQNMEGAIALVNEIKEISNLKTLLVGGHIAALPTETLSFKSVDFVCQNEGVYTILDLLKVEDLNNQIYLEKVDGLGWKKYGIPYLNKTSPIVPQEKLVEDLPGIAWDLLPSPDKYRTSGWHAWSNGSEKTPFASIYTSLGCPFKCFVRDVVIPTVGPNTLIQNVKLGTQLIGMDEKTKTLAKTEVVRLVRNKVETLVQIYFPNGYKLRCTEEHPFFVDGKWVEAKDLKGGDFISSISFRERIGFTSGDWENYPVTRLAKVSKIEILKPKAPIDVYNFECSPHNNYFAGFKGCSYFVLSHNCSFCLDESTTVIKSDRTGKNIREVVNGETLLAYDTENEKIVETTVKESSNRKSPHLRKIIFGGGKVVKATPEHPFFVDGKWVDAKDLKVGMICLGADEYTIPRRMDGRVILDIKEMTGSFNVYNFRCEPYNNFFAEWVLTHNCMINIINRTDNSPGVASDKSATFRYWEPDHIIREFDKLAEMGVKNVKIADELFVLRESHFMEVCKRIIERKYGFNIWCYSRVDTCKPHYLETLKKAGVNWLALGIESPNQVVRKDVIKGGYKEVKIHDLLKMISDAGINVGANYIFGLPEDTLETMKETLQFAMDAKTENFNGYSTMSYPGSPLYYTAVENGWTLPDRFSGYSQHSYYTQNLPSKHVSAADVLRFRDEAWMKYFTNESYLSMMESKFGKPAVDNIRATTKIRLKRRLLGDVL